MCPGNGFSHIPTSHAQSNSVCCVYISYICTFVEMPVGEINFDSASQAGIVDIWGNINLLSRQRKLEISITGADRRY